MTVTIRHGDCREVLATLPAESVHCVVTSPPYWRQRDYGMADQIGLELTPLGRDAILIELNPEYVETAGRRLRGDAGMFADVGTVSLSSQQGNAP